MEWQDIKSLYRALMEMGKKAHAWLIVYPTIILSVLVLLGFFLNIQGAKDLNLFFALFIALGFVLMAMRPELTANLILAGIFSGIIRTPNTMEQEIGRMIRNYLTLCKNILLYLLLTFLTLGLISFREHPLGFLTLVLLAVFIVLAGDVWGIGGRLGRKLIYLYACFMVILTICLLIPQPVWNKIGFDPLSYWRTTQTEKALAEVEEAQKKQQDKQDSGRLGVIAQKIARGERLSQKEENFLNKKRDQAEKNSIPGKVSQIFKSEQPKALVPKMAVYEKRPDGTWEGGFPVLESQMGETLFLKIKTSIGIVTYRGNLIDGWYTGTWSDSKRQRGKFKINASSLRGKLYDNFYPQEGWLNIVIRKEHG